MTITTITYLNTQGELPADYKPQISLKYLLKGYKAMLLTRHIDERMITLQRQGLITFAMSSLGEEACSVASAAALAPQDWMYPQYRESGILFWRGYTPQQYIHQMFGDSQDLGLGRQMPNHFGSKALNVVTVSSPVGTQIPQAAGCAYAMKLQKEDAVSICYFGEGTASEGDFHVGLNIAAVKKAPVIFFCRNNGYAISTPCARQFSGEGIAERGAGYGITSFRVDGNDFFALYDIVAKARRLCLEGQGPILIEAMTYRMGAHSTSDDPSLYRNEEEVSAWKEKCPVLRLRRYLENAGEWSAQKEAQFNKEITEEIKNAINTAKTTSKPALSHIIEDVYFEVPDTLKQQYKELEEAISAEKTKS